MIAGLLLAGGSGSRFGGDKLLAPLPGDGRAVGVAAAQALAAAVEELVAVVRPGSEGLAAALRAAGCEVIESPEAVDGMGASLAAGVRARPDADGWVVGLADLPWLRAETAARVVGRLAAAGGIVAPEYRGQQGHPVGFAAEFGEALRALSGDTGARAIVEAHAQRLQLIETDDPGVLRDVDTPADLAGPADRS